MEKRPVIGLNMSLDIGKKYERYDLRVPFSYVDAVAGAGGIPLCLPIVDDLQALPVMLSHIHGILFIGGDDYHPTHYGGHEQPEGELMPERRDRFDMKLAGAVLQKTTLPVLGICGGHQLMCITQGGKLIQDIATEWQSPKGSTVLPHSKRDRRGAQKSRYLHPVNIMPGSLAACVTGVGDERGIVANSTHHQAVHPDFPGADLCASAWTNDGIVEALEPAGGSLWAKKGRFILGVQWHPEKMQNMGHHQRIFGSFVDEARKYMAEKK
jgi:putative glutamine amidotransferase